MLTRLILIGLSLPLSIVHGEDDLAERRIDNFNLNWSFVRDADYDDQPPTEGKWKAIHIPHDYSIESKFVREASDADNKTRDVGELGLHLGNKSTGFLPGGLAWYKKVFVVPEKENGKKIQILFDGVSMYSDVWINGHHLGHHHYGYTAFSYDLTTHVKVGEANTLLVRVNNKLESRWYAGSGIYRDVKLVITDKVHCPLWGVHATTPEVSSEKALVLIETKVTNHESSAKNVKIRSRIIGKDDKEVGVAESGLKIEAGTTATVNHKNTLANPLLWTLENPNLYKVFTEIYSDGKRVDGCTTQFGIRKLEFGAEEGFLLNGKFTKLKGMCIHHDNGLLGAESYQWAEERKVIKLKGLGCNAIRCAHNPPSTTFLDACDKHGILVINEAFDEWKIKKANGYAPHFEKWWKNDVTSMVLRDRNHPSVIMWSIGNEIPEQGNPEGAVTAKMLADFVRSLDSTRPTTHAIQPGFKDWGDRFPDAKYFNAVDICGYNYENLSLKKHGIGFEKSHDEFPKRIMYQSESMMTSFFADWTLINEHKYILGDFVWTGIDYLGEVGCGAEKKDQKNYPAFVAMCGDLDIGLFRKPRSYYRQLLWNMEPTVYMTVRRPKEEGYSRSGWGWEPSVTTWTWTVDAGKEMTVDVYSGCEQVELKLNGKSLGTKKSSKENAFIATWAVPYQKGELKAIGLKNGKAVDESVLRTAEGATVIGLSADRTEIKADGCDVSFITLEFRDQNGIVNPWSNDEVTFTVTGPATIAAIGSSSPYAAVKYPYHGDKTAPHQGRAQLVIRSTDKPGTITIQAVSKNTKDTTIAVESK